MLEELAERLRSCGKALGDPYSEVSQGTQHLADRGVLAADAGYIAEADFIQGENVFGHRNRPIRRYGLIVHDFTAWDTALFAPDIEQQDGSVSKRTVFFVSDQTGVTAETMGHSLLTQFDGAEYQSITLPFIATVSQAAEVVQRINVAGRESALRPIVFATLVDDAVRAV